MARVFALFLVVLVLLQTFSRELLVLDYQARRAEITQLFCVNKDKPRLQCNGKCHLGKQLRKTTDAESKAPGAGFAKVKYDLLLPLPLRGLQSPAASLVPSVAFAGGVASCYAFSPVHGIFHPPAFRA